MRTLSTVSLALAWCAFCGGAFADELPAIRAARSDFERGLELVREGRFDGALEAFERAYRVRPHHAVLYNIGQAHSSAGRPVQAVAAFERLLREDGLKVPVARRAEVEKVLTEERAKLGQLKIEPTPGDAEVWLDGQRVDPENAVDVLPGSHLVSARRPGYSAKVELIAVERGETKAVALDLAPETSTVLAQGFVRIVCSVPGVSLSIDGEPRGTTPFPGPVFTNAGVRRMEFTRRGYVGFVGDLRVPAGGGTHANCAMVPDLGSRSTGSLSVVTSERSTVVTIDGVRAHHLPLPAGPHTVRVLKDGFVPWERTVWSGTGPRRVTVRLAPTPERRHAMGEERRRRIVWSLGAMVGGAALGIGAGVVYAWNDGRYRDWRRQSNELDLMAAQGDRDAASSRRSRAIAGQAADIQRVDDIALGMARAGGGALLTGAILSAATLIDARF
jgi:hypothetical protein